MSELSQRHQITFNATAFWLGFNQGLGLVTNKDLITCAGDFIPTLQYLSVVLQSIQSFAFGVAFEYIDPLVDVLHKFKAECQPVHTEFANYFGAAAQAFQEDQSAFFRTVISNLKSDRLGTLVKIGHIGVFLYENKDFEAGKAFVPLVQTAIKNYL